MDLSSFNIAIKNVLRISESFKHNCLIISENGCDQFYNNIFNDLCYSFKNINEIDKLIKYIDNLQQDKINDIIYKNKIKI